MRKTLTALLMGLLAAGLVSLAAPAGAAQAQPERHCYDDYPGRGRPPREVLCVSASVSPSVSVSPSTSTSATPSLSSSTSPSATLSPSSSTSATPSAPSTTAPPSVPTTTPSTTTPPPPASGGSSLPVTGVPVGLMTAAGALVLGTGAGLMFVVRRRRVSFTA